MAISQAKWHLLGPTRRIAPRLILLQIRSRHLLLFTPRPSKCRRRIAGEREQRKRAVVGGLQDSEQLWFAFCYLVHPAIMISIEALHLQRGRLAGV
jgi:hypothetical protein